MFQLSDAHARRVGWLAIAAASFALVYYLAPRLTLRSSYVESQVYAGRR